MLILQIRRSSISEESVSAFSSLLSTVPQTFRPLLHQTLTAQAEILDLPLDRLRRAGRPKSLSFSPRIPVNAEIFTDGTSLYVITVQERGRNLANRQGAGSSREREKPFWLYLYYVGSELNSASLATLEGVVNETLNATLTPYYYIAERFEQLKAEGRTPPTPPSAEEISGATVLQDRAVRTLAIAIKASGGLLVRDLAKQLPAEARDQVNTIQAALKAGGLINAEIVVVCSKTQAQTARAPSRDILESLSQQGLKCACGRRIADEKIEEALTITEQGRSLLDGSRWLTLLVLRELESVGVRLEKTLVEQQAGGDEMDLLADISGELAFFELKDKEFNLGNAYSFGAKIGILRPSHPVVISTEYVGTDAKDHFNRARLASSRREYVSAAEQTPEIRYVEGLNNLTEGIQALAAEIYFADAARILDEAMQVASLDSSKLLRAVQARTDSSTSKDERHVPPVISASGAVS